MARRGESGNGGGAEPSPVDRQGRFLTAIYRYGERMEAQRGAPTWRWNWLIAWAKVHPILGSAVQGLAFGVFFLPFPLLFAVLGMPLWFVGVLAAASALLFGMAMFAFNQYSHRHGEPWLHHD